MTAFVFLSSIFLSSKLAVKILLTCLLKYWAYTVTNVNFIQNKILKRRKWRMMNGMVTWTQPRHTQMCKLNSKQPTARFIKDLKLVMCLTLWTFLYNYTVILHNDIVTKFSICLFFPLLWVLVPLFEEKKPLI